ncbi:MAG: sugar phosphate isomerase/epimerase [Phycisphaeraceae bacterium]|nr:sugar phosphate isomerase/epimerase [Phycisphaeraceae bacterium]MCW5753448.1 sugar phosphate isomerase/epimerase [Phycisphaeraceae bacterium]
MKPAFSTVACPEWTLDEVASAARRMSFDGVELRTFGFGETQLNCDPMQTDPDKVRSIFSACGVVPLSLATSLRFDERVWPPVLGLAFMDDEAMIRRCRRIIEAASLAGIPYVRVYGYQLHGNESRKSAVRRIAARLRLAVDACRNTGVQLLLENGGSFATSDQLLELIEQSDMHNLLCAAYSAPVGRSAGETLETASARLGEKLHVVKMKDIAEGRPVRFGDGGGRVQRDLHVLASIGFAGWVVVEHDRLWVPEACNAEEALSGAAALILGEHARHARQERPPAATHSGSVRA